METIVVISGVLVTAILAVFGIVRANLKICQPNEVLIFSGRRRSTSDGTKVGYRFIKGGRGFRIPLLEQVDRIRLNTIPLDLTVQNAYSKGGIPLTVRAIANVKVASNESELANAVERLLGKDPHEIQMIAKETLEGNLRGVLATLTPEEVNEDRLKFAKELLAEADIDLSNLGLQLDTMKIQSVEDDAGYLDAIGRQQSAHIIAAARVAEAEKREQARLAETNADKSIEQAENDLRILKAQLSAKSAAEEARIDVAAEVSAAQARQQLAIEEIELAEKRQRADVVVAAEAERQAKEEIAKGNAARIFEDGQAEVEVLRQKLALWQEAGPNAERLFLIQMLPDILKQVVQTVDNLSIDKLTVVDSGNGTGVPSVFNQIAGSTPALLESLKASTGIDIATMLSGASGAPEKDE
ncbi:MAG: flotillin family protein [Rhodothermaceae bacterium]|nr:SPFH domain-containing protein [Bacteroidota bacterium]MXX97618.1 flotillin family protein [Rhodothermaceae bacterium]MXZ57936.1 flotillin family protein [Rhodothermaceae bacterium]MYB91055.1 flotillin family protein [Rhodothermaceae bacterium]MYD67627.1 flotillin family protein [Rhodothermaceae bacterium]